MSVQRRQLNDQDGVTRLMDQYCRLSHATFHVGVFDRRQEVHGRENMLFSTTKFDENPYIHSVFRARFRLLVLEEQTSASSVSVI